MDAQDGRDFWIGGFVDSLTRTHFPGAECQKQDFQDLTDYQD